MAQLTVESATLSKSGKSYLIKSGGQTYFSKPEQGIQNHVGEVIEAKITTSEYQGKEMLWINEYKATGAPKEEGKIYSAAPIKQPPNWQPMASNVVAQAVLAGHIKEPSDIQAWVFGVRNALKAAEDEDIPY